MSCPSRQISQALRSRPQDPSGAIKFGYPIADGGIGQVPVGIAIVVSHRWHERWVGINKGNVEEKREGRTNTGERVASGTYFYTLLGGGMYFHVSYIYSHKGEPLWPSGKS